MIVTKSKTKEAILRSGGTVLNEDFIQHRALYDVMQEIESTPKEALQRLDEMGAGLLHYAAKLKDGLPIIKLLLRKGLDPSVKDDLGNRPINYAKVDSIIMLLLKETSKQ